MESMTKSENQIMKLLWSTDKPLSCTEIVKLSDDKTWKDSYVHSMIKSLLKKGIVKIVSFELISRSYARKFAPAVSYFEYLLLTGFSDQDLNDPKKMSEFFEIFWDKTKSPEMKQRIQYVLNK